MKNKSNSADVETVNVKYDVAFDIATGRTRKETHWRNRKTTWSAFLNKIKDTHRTPETHAEYMAAKKTRQDEIKDIGGFVGGYINNGRRKAGNILHRQLVTLDIDFAKDDIWDFFTMLNNCAAAIYSTHKHSPANQRLRLIIPLDREVGTDEYVAITRRIAGDLDINAFDDTTFEPSRLMYWPSTSKDGDYVFNFQDGPWLSADYVLGMYKNWQDASEWPISDRVDKVINREIKKQGDPLEKPGVVGAFCRTYNIHEAIETFLGDIYEVCDVENRYTYKEGSTAAGLVVYDDKFSYSHHGTDPTSGKLCNSFDLVRLHMFGLKDENAHQNTPNSKLPSYTEMVQLAAKDGKTRKQLGLERLQDAKADFSELLEGEEINSSWLQDMDVDSKGNYKPTTANIRLVLNNDPNLKGCFAKNKFEQREVALHGLPWRKVDPKDPYLKDFDDAGVRDYLESNYSITGVQKVKDALDLTIQSNSFHPVRDYLNSLEWDGVLRGETVSIDYLGVEDSAYTRATMRKALTAAVKRIFEPGCKFDYVLVFIGKQGEGKSMLLRKLGGKWFSDSFTTVQGKEAYEQIQGVWIVEMAELAGLKKAEFETIKHFITKQEDRFRVAYGKRVENFPRQCAFFGTDNNRDFLRDPTGNRRFWPQDTFDILPTKNVFEDLTHYEVDQIWAEAVQWYNAGEKLYLDKDLEAEAIRRQTEHTETDERAGIVREFLDTLLPENWDERELYERKVFWQSRGEELGETGVMVRDRVCVAEIWCEALGKDKAEMTRYNTKDLHNIMRNVEGWEEHKSNKLRFGIYGVQKAYIRKQGYDTGNSVKSVNVANVATSCQKKQMTSNVIMN